VACAASTRLNAVISLFKRARRHAPADPPRRAHPRRESTKGGDQANIIPEYTSAEFSCARRPFPTAVSCCGASRSPRKARRRHRLPRSDFARSDRAEPLKATPRWRRPSSRNLEYIDFPEDPDDGHGRLRLTDCGNVSQQLPTIHPYIRISPDACGSLARVRRVARSPLARAGMLAGAKALA